MLCKCSALALVAATMATSSLAQPVPTLTVRTDRATAQVSRTLYGLMTEEINFSYEGGLYGELIRNRSFLADATFNAQAKDPLYWSTVGDAKMALDPTTPLNDALTTSLKLDVTLATKARPTGASNGGYWGIAVTPRTAYTASLYAKAAPGFTGPLVLTLQTADGKTVFATAKIAHLTQDWARYDVTLTTRDVAPSKANVFTVTTTAPGTIWLQQVSLFPPTYKGTKNGNRADLMQMMADMKPAFLRMPGGNYLEGDTIAERFDWKKTLGDPATRPGHRSPWKYWSTDGMGLLEFLKWCEDLKMEPVLAVYAGYSLHQERVPAGDAMLPYIQDALDEIEYVSGDVSTKWGAQRAKDGHPAPFPLRYVEIGNEDWFDKESTYDARFTQFYDAIKAKYPQLQLISTISPEQPEAKHVHSRTPDLIDEHLYPSSEGAMESRAHEFDTLPRTGPKIFVGEWATRIGAPTPNMTAAIADAAWMTGMERNSDLVVLESYAPLLVNVSNPTNGRDRESSMQWPSDLIGYDAQSAYGSPSYYAQAMFANHHGDEILAVEDRDIPTWTWTPEIRTHNGVPDAPKPAQVLPALYYNATRDSRTGTITLKVVNRNPTPQPVHIVLSGGASVAATGTAIVLKADSGDATNTLANPKKIVPMTETVSGLGRDFTREFPPLSVTVLELQRK